MASRRYYRMTPARRAALKKAQLASARKRRKNRNLRIGVAAVGTTAALVGAGVWRHKRSGSSLVVRSLSDTPRGNVRATVLNGYRGINTETRLKKWGNSSQPISGPIKRGVIGQSIGNSRKMPFGISVSRSPITNAKPIVKGTKVWLSGEKVLHHQYSARIGGFGKGWELTYTHSRYVPRGKRKANLGIPVVPQRRIRRKADPTVPFYKGQRGNWPKGKINPKSPKNIRMLQRNREN